MNAATAILLGLALAAATPAARAECLDSADWFHPVIHNDSPELTRKARETVAGIVGQALANAQSVGAASLLAQAATLEAEAAGSARQPRATVSAGIGYGERGIEGSRRERGRLASLGIEVTAPLFDSGRTTATLQWRQHLAQAARLGEVDVREQLALKVVSLALERSRQYKRGQVSRQQSQRLGCVVQSLERVVKADPGRRSELDQARKSLLEADLARTRSESIKRQVEIQLQRLTGAPLPRLEGLTTLLADTPSIDAVQARSDESPAVRQQREQADAAAALSRSLRAESRPRVDLNVSGSRTDGIGDADGWRAGVNLVIPLLAPGTRELADAAQRRAQAASLELADVREDRHARIADVHTQATALSAEGAELEAILQSSARVREATLAQWQRLGKRSLFDVMSAERDHFGLRLAQVDTLHDRQQANAILWSLGAGVNGWLGDSYQR